MIPTEAPDRLFGRIWVVIYQLICLFLFVNTKHRRERAAQRTTRHIVKRFLVSLGFSSKSYDGRNSQCEEAERSRNVSITKLCQA